MYKNTGNWSLALIVLSSLAFGIHCDHAEGTQESNEECEGECTIDYLEEWADFNADLPSCMSECIETNDLDCVLDCEGFSTEYDQDYLLCMADCPCIAEQNSCNANCDTGDFDCFADCTDGYHECAGGESQYYCTTLCSIEKTDCLNSCEDTYTTIQEYSNCFSECNLGFVECVQECISGSS